MSHVTYTQSLYENLFNIATAHSSVRGIRHSFHENPTSASVGRYGGGRGGRSAVNIFGRGGGERWGDDEEEEALSFDQLTGVMQVCCSVLRVVASVRSVV